MLELKEKFDLLKKPLLLDGAMGSILQSTKDYVDSPLWSSIINIKNPDVVIDLHKQYINAGADIITANSFRTNPIAIEASGCNISLKRLVNATVNLAYSAVSNNKEIFVAGSNAPAEDCYKTKRTITHKELEQNHIKHIDSLMMSGVDFVLNETFSHLDEIKIVSEFCTNHDIPFVLSLFINKDLSILSGESIQEVVKYVKGFNPLSILINCIPISIYKNVFDKKLNINGFYLNCGLGEYTNKNIDCGIDSESYAENVKSFLNSNLKIIGSCCGSSPSHTKLLRTTIDELY